MLSLVRADAAGVANGLAVVPLSVSFLDRRSSADEQRHHAVVHQPIPGRPVVYGSFKRSISFHSQVEIVGAVAAALGLALGYSLWLGLKTSAEKGTRRTKRDWAAAAPFFAAAAALILASISLHKVVTLERVQREGSKKKEYDSVADEWVHQRVTESESDDDSVEALTVRTPLQ